MTENIWRDYLDLGNDRGASGSLSEAIAFYDRAIKIKPDFHQAWNNRGVALHKLGRYQESIESYNKALEIKPDYEEVRASRELVLKDFNDWRVIANILKSQAY